MEAVWSSLQTVGSSAETECSDLMDNCFPVGVLAQADSITLVSGLDFSNPTPSPPSEAVLGSLDASPLHFPAFNTPFLYHQKE